MPYFVEFAACSKLDYIVIPSSVTKMGSSIASNNTTVFEGWYTSSGFEPTSKVDVGKYYYSATDSTLYARWLSEEEYNAGSSLDKQIVIEQGVPTTVNITREGQQVFYKFVAPTVGRYTFSRSNYIGDKQQSVLVYYTENKAAINMSENNDPIANYLSQGEVCYVSGYMTNPKTLCALDLTVKLS